MYRLADDMARTRRLYRRPLVTLPDVLLLDIPARYAGAELPLGHYYPIIVETEAEHSELEDWLALPRPAPVAPDLLNHRPSQIESDRITFAAYAPPAPGWPHLLLCHWPAIYAALAKDPMLFAREAYTTELFETDDDLDAASRVLLDTLRVNGPVDIFTITPFRGPPGLA